MPVDRSDDPDSELLVTPAVGGAVGAAGGAAAPPTWPWTSVEALAEVDSTNAESLRHPRPWRLVSAQTQTQGRGRHSRVWESRAGASASLSMTVPMSEDPAAWGWLPLVTGLAVVEALAEVTEGRGEFFLKWPNDVLVAEPGERGPAKVCGILCETAPSPDGGAPLVVVGVGINLAQGHDELPVPTAGSLRTAGLPVPDAVEVVAAVARCFARRHRQWYDGGRLPQLRADYRARCVTLGQDVEVHLPGERVATGRAVAVADDGEIVVESGGVRTAYAAGDVVHLRPGVRRGGGAAPGAGPA